MAVVSSYLRPFVITIVVEITVAVALGYRSRSMIAGLFFLNLLTNPATNLVFRVACYYGLLSGRPASMVGLEIMVVIVEWLVLNYMFPGRSRSTLVLSLAMNCTSFLAGMMLLRA